MCIRDSSHSVWFPHIVIASDSFEKVQKRATKVIHGFEKLRYSERLWKYELPTLKYRRIRGDMIETYKITRIRSVERGICPIAAILCSVNEGVQIVGIWAYITPKSLLNTPKMQK